MSQKIKNILHWITIPLSIFIIIFAADFLSGYIDVFILKYSGLFDPYVIANQLSEIGKKGTMIHFAELDRFAIICGIVSIIIYSLSLIPIYFFTKKIAPSNKKKIGFIAVLLSSFFPIYFLINLMIKFIL